MKTTVNHSQRIPIISYLFFGIAASIFTLSVFFSFYEQESRGRLYEDVGSLMTSRMSKPLAAHVTEIAPINLKELMVEDEVPLQMESWMTEPITVVPAVTYPTTDIVEADISMESWMTGLETWSIPSDVNYVEPALTVETWMLNATEWSSFNDLSLSSEVVEEPMYVESWMLNLEGWAIESSESECVEAPLYVEAWMLNMDSWEIAQK